MDELLRLEEPGHRTNRQLSNELAVSAAFQLRARPLLYDKQSEPRVSAERRGRCCRRHKRQQGPAPLACEQSAMRSMKRASAGLITAAATTRPCALPTGRPIPKICSSPSTTAISATSNPTPAR